ncbi:hypothetical protein KIPE111705_05185 [Kibdelosporangium persicum]
MASLPEVDTRENPGRYTPMPRWVKVSGVIALVVMLVVVITLLARGPHRPDMTGGGDIPASNTVAPGSGHDSGWWGH